MTCAVRRKEMCEMGSGVTNGWRRVEVGMRAGIGSPQREGGGMYRISEFGNFLYILRGARESSITPSLCALSRCP